METENNVPNLDCMNDDDLMTFWRVHLTQSRYIAATLFPDRPRGYVRAARQLALYASNKATAQGLRTCGRISLAMQYDGIVDRIYQGLPTWARW